MTPCHPLNGIATAPLESVFIKKSSRITAHSIGKHLQFTGVSTTRLLSSSSSLEGFNSNEHWLALNHVELPDHRKGPGHGCIWRVMDHQDQWDAAALVPFGLDHRRDSDLRPAENGRDSGQRSRPVNHAQAQIIARSHLVDLRDG